MSDKRVALPTREVLGWAMYDFANSGYATVVLTAVYSTYFVGVIAADLGNGDATFLWTMNIALANLLVLITAPLIGAIADHSACKKRFLLITTSGCVIFTASLALTGANDVMIASILVVAATIMFHSGENLIAAFLPDISTPENMGRTSAFGWTVGYLGGLLILGICLAYVTHAQAQQASAESYVPVTMLIVAIAFALASIPTFLWLKETKQVQNHAAGHAIRSGFQRLWVTFQHARHYRDLFRFLATVFIYHCGIQTVVVLAAVYAQEVMKFSTADNMVLILVVNVTAAAGAFLFGRVQDAIGSRPTLIFTLLIWIAALVLAFFTESRATFWLVGNLVGLALGASQSAGRALVGIFSPPSRSGEFFGLWGLATKLSAVVGPLVYGLIASLSHGNHRYALLSTAIFFIVGIVTLLSVDETRGKIAARSSDLAQ
ncbi:MAG: MFS transporter [Gammaproteobacteria bacterium]|nr:MFS transporter [Gammaproteobacteria bacterium]